MALAESKESEAGATEEAAVDGGAGGNWAKPSEAAGAGEE